jgi:transcriptional regulator with XRE-family HTH domain
MQELDKVGMGQRIRQIRTAAGLRQWELARLLGTTQSAVHKYEHGVVPEPRRLIELARIGNTSIEWILTGTHWESGSPEQHRVSPDVLRTALLLRELRNRDAVDEALRILRAAVEALARSDSAPGGLSEETVRLLETASRIQAAVVQCLMGDATGRLAEWPPPGRDGSAGPGQASAPPPTRR